MSSSQPISGRRATTLSLSGTQAVVKLHQVTSNSTNPAAGNANLKQAQKTDSEKRTSPGPKSRALKAAAAAAVAAEITETTKLPNEQKIQNGNEQNNANANDKEKESEHLSTNCNSSEAAAIAGAAKETKKEKTEKNIKESKTTEADKRIHSGGERKCKIEIRRESFKDIEGYVEKASDNTAEKTKEHEVKTAADYEEKSNEQATEPDEKAKKITIVSDPKKSVSIDEKAKSTELNNASMPVAQSTTAELTPEKRILRKVALKTPINKTSLVSKSIFANDEECISTATADSDEVNMEPFAIKASPIKFPTVAEKCFATVTNPTATSTPGRLLPNIPKAEGKVTTAIGGPIERREFARIGPRRSIHASLDERYSYRRFPINLDDTATTNTSINATAGSDVHNNSSFSFSFFGLSRKRDRTTPPPPPQAAAALRDEVGMSPPKRPRLEKSGFLTGLLNSPMTALRYAFIKTAIDDENTLNCRDEIYEVDSGDVNAGAEDVGVQNLSKAYTEEGELNRNSNEADLKIPKEDSVNKAGKDKENVAAENHEKLDLKEISHTCAKKNNRCNIM